MFKDVLTERIGSFHTVDNLSCLCYW